MSFSPCVAASLSVLSGATSVIRQVLVLFYCDKTLYSYSHGQVITDLSQSSASCSFICSKVSHITSLKTRAETQACEGGIFY